MSTTRGGVYDGSDIDCVPVHYVNVMCTRSDIGGARRLKTVSSECGLKGVARVERDVPCRPGESFDAVGGRRCQSLKYNSFFDPQLERRLGFNHVKMSN